MYRGFPPYLPHKQRPDVVITAIVWFAPVTDCNSPTCGVRRNAVRASGGAMDWRLSVKQEKSALFTLTYAFKNHNFTCVIV
jgi:hypothetical protein